VFQLKTCTKRIPFSEHVTRHKISYADSLISFSQGITVNKHVSVLLKHKYFGSRLTCQLVAHGNLGIAKRKEKTKILERTLEICPLVLRIH